MRQPFLHWLAHFEKLRCVKLSLYSLRCMHCGGLLVINPKLNSLCLQQHKRFKSVNDSTHRYWLLPCESSGCVNSCILVPCSWRRFMYQRKAVTSNLLLKLVGSDEILSRVEDTFKSHIWIVPGVQNCWIHKTHIDSQNKSTYPWNSIPRFLLSRSVQWNLCFHGYIHGSETWWFTFLSSIAAACTGSLATCQQRYQHHRVLFVSLIRNTTIVLPCCCRCIWFLLSFFF